jgi:hypothetical protein
MVSPNAVNHFQYTGDIKMKESKQLNEQELGQIAGGVRTVINPDSMFPAPGDRLGIIVPDYKVELVGSNPTPHPPGKQARGRRGLNPDIM